MYNLYNFEAEFKRYLVSVNNSNVTIRNYLSDTRYFHGWLITTSFYSKDTLLLNSDMLLAYKAYLVAVGLPIKTVNRRLSSMRKLCSFLRNQAIIDSFPEQSVSNVIINKNSPLETELNSNKLISSKLLSDMKRDKVEYHLQNIQDFITALSN